MLQNWLKPLPAALAKAADALPGEHFFGRRVLRHTAAWPVMKGVQVALIGVGDREANLVREQLYRTSHAFPDGAVADLGNLRKAEPGVLQPVVHELLAGRILPVVLAAPDELAGAQFLAYQETKALVNQAVVNETLRLDAPPYMAMLAPPHPSLLHLSLIGYQVHQTPAAVTDVLNRHNFESLRLGRSRAALEETEPLIRDADLLTFHLGALKLCEAPGVAQATPSGFFLEEACQLCRYAGLSDKLTSFGIYGFRSETDRDNQTAQAAAQMIWYFLDGFFNRKQDYPVSKDGLTEYIVEFRKMNYQLTFWKSVKSGRWWMQVPTATKKKHERHRLVPCSYQDYQSACREELPDRLMQAFRRFG
jgi:formiminoglutamase